MPLYKQMRIWGGFFFKRFREGNQDYAIYLRHCNLYAQHLMNKYETEKLRRELSVQHKVLQERRAVLRELKALE